MVIFLIRRLLAMTTVLLVMTVIVFALFPLVPGGPEVSMAERHWLWLMELTADVGGSMGGKILLSAKLNASVVILIVAVSFTAGLYGAIRPHGWGSKGVRLLAGLGVGAPPLLLALMIAALAGGLGQPLPGGLWFPVIVVGVWGSARMTRRMRWELVHEQDRGSMAVGRARGLSSSRALWAYPVRTALGPFFTGLGRLIPQVVAGTMVVSWVLSLPTAGAALLDALLVRDMLVAGTLLLILTALALVGVLISDMVRGAVDVRLRSVRKGTL